MELKNRLGKTLLGGGVGVLLVFAFVGTANAAVTVTDGCDIGGGANDIDTLTASFDATTDIITVDMLLCADLDNGTKYRVHFDHTAPFFNTADKNDDGMVDANDICFTTSDDTMMRRRHKGNDKDTGPGTITPDTDTLTFTVPVDDLDLGLALGDTVYIWADTRLKGITDRAPNTESGDGCSKPEVAAEVLALELVAPIPADCVVANGLTWCFNNGACGEACNAVCASKGLTPVADNTLWFQAQNTVPKCQAISQAFGLGTNVQVGGFTFACVEDTTPTNTVGGGLVSPLLCSLASSCPQDHRMNMDQLGIACGSSSARRSICPCE